MRWQVDLEPKRGPTTVRLLQRSNGSRTVGRQLSLAGERGNVAVTIASVEALWLPVGDRSPW